MKRDADSAATAERGEVATNYIGIRTAQVELRVAQRNVEIERRGYMIAKRRAEEGAVTEVDPAQAAAAPISPEPTRRCSPPAFDHVLARGPSALRVEAPGVYLW
jgi:hypothetical protein